MKTKIVKMGEKYCVKVKDSLLSCWRGVDVKEPFNWTRWTSLGDMERFCLHDTYAEAKKLESKLYIKTVDETTDIETSPEIRTIRIEGVVYDQQDRPNASHHPATNWVLKGGSLKIYNGEDLVCEATRVTRVGKHTFFVDHHVYKTVDTDGNLVETFVPVV